jgi:hypothetical protein
MGVDGAHATRDVGTSSNICGKVPNSWFTEGFDTIDLQEARGLIEDLSRENGFHISVRQNRTRKHSDWLSRLLHLPSPRRRGGITPLNQGLEAQRGNPRVMEDNIRPLELRDKPLLSC